MDTRGLMHSYTRMVAVILGGGDDHSFRGYTAKSSISAHWVHFPQIFGIHAACKPSAFAHCNSAPSICHSFSLTRAVRGSL